MTLHDYFARHSGVGVFASADGDGRVNTAIYAAPHVVSDGTVVFLMREWRSWHNLRSNPRAAYLFLATGSGYSGLRLQLTLLREDQDPLLAATMTRSGLSAVEDQALGPKHLVYFAVDEVRPLVGDADPGVSIR